uniref:Ionotropic glutamate receptor C-terminal domain-containing protein n=1 Tax=Stomoxys calcitrans TaxID=35570 RepID=A0A2Y9D4J3_STOCA
MHTSWQIVFQVFTLLASYKANELENQILAIEKTGKQNFTCIGQLIKEIHKEAHIESLFIIEPQQSRDSRLKIIYEMGIPKLILSPGQVVQWQKLFSRNMLTVAVLQEKWQSELWRTLARSLNFIRQTRILMVMAPHLETREKLNANLLKNLENYKMTNVLICFPSNAVGDSLDITYHAVKPYPWYHLQSFTWQGEANHSFYPPHWRNFHNMSIITMPDQSITNSMVFYDGPGKWKLNGLAARLVILFAEHYNASLRYYMPLEDETLHKGMHWAELTTLTAKGLINIPMMFRPDFNGSHWLIMPYPFLVGKWLVTVPCGQRMHIKEVYTLLTTKEVTAIFLLAMLVFSLLHSVMNKVCGGTYLKPINLLLNDKIIPGLLGQAVSLTSTAWFAQKLMYLLLFLFGLNLSTSFTAHLNTMITSLPFHKEIETFEDLNRVNRKILFNTLDTKSLVDTNRLKPMENVLVYTDNNTLYRETRNSLNTSYGYAISSTLWSIYEQQQLYMGQRLFCAPPGLTLYDILPSGIPLEVNSEFKEAIEHFIFQTYTVGLQNQWYSSLFVDLVKYKQIPFSRGAPKPRNRTLNLDDFHWVWMIVLVGLGGSALTFVGEIMLHYFLRKRKWGSNQIRRRKQKVIKTAQQQQQFDNNKEKIIF